MTALTPEKIYSTEQPANKVDYDKYRRVLVMREMDIKLRSLIPHYGDRITIACLDFSLQRVDAKESEEETKATLSQMTRLLIGHRLQFCIDTSTVAFICRGVTDMDAVKLFITHYLRNVCNTIVTGGKEYKVGVRGFACRGEDLDRNSAEVIRSSVESSKLIVQNSLVFQHGETADFMPLALVDSTMYLENMLNFQADILQEAAQN